VILLSLEVGERGGAGLNLWIAIPLSLAFALGIGYFNGQLVERTKLPSFIITLATFFVLIGAKLGFSKLIVDQVQVGDIREASGYEFWRRIFASEWQRNHHQWAQRDRVFLVLISVIAALVLIAVAEMQFARRRSSGSAIGVPVLAIGAVTSVVGIAALHRTDSVAGNVLGAGLIGAGTVVGLVGLGLWRFEPVGDRGGIRLSGRLLQWLVLGVVSFVLAMVIAAAMDPYDDTNLFFPFTHQGLRATVFMLLAGLGLTAMSLSLVHARRVSVMTRTVVLAVLAALLGVMAFFVRSQSVSVKFRAEAFSVMLAVTLVVIAWVVLGFLFTERNSVDFRSDALGTRLLVIAGVLIVVAFVVRLLFTLPSEIEAGIIPAKFSVRTLWFAGFTAVCVFVLGKTRFGSWTFAVGGNKEAARQVGVPAARTKPRLFMLVSGAAWLVGMLLAFRLNTIQANTGNGEEFEYIIAAVVGGTLLTGGYGSALGFLGVTLLLAVIANRSIRARAEAMRR